MFFIAPGAFGCCGGLKQTTAMRSSLPRSIRADEVCDGFDSDQGLFSFFAQSAFLQCAFFVFFGEFLIRQLLLCFWVLFCF